MLLSLAFFALLAFVLARTRLRGAAGWTLYIGAFLELALCLVVVLAWRLGANDFDESVTFHLINGVRGVSLQILAPIIAIVVAALVVFALVLVGLHRLGRNARRSTARGALAFALLALALITNPVLRETAITGYVYASESEREPPEYVRVDNPQLAARPNIVTIYLESLERTYLDPQRFPELAPNLQRLESEGISFTDIQQTYGTGWTMAGMVASQCGVPLSTDIWNSMSGLEWFLPGATCVGDILAAAGYRQEYLGGAELAFAGKGSFYRTHGYQSIAGLTELKPKLRDKSYLNEWGLYDDTLFDLVGKRFDALVAAGRPFALTMLTNSTHQPDGNRARDCKAHYGDGGDPILDAVHCSDRRVAELVEHIRSSRAGQNTIIVIASDHLAMRSNTEQTWLAGQKRRNLLTILKPGATPEQIDKPGTTLDTAPTVLGLIAPIHALGFGRDLRADQETLAQKRPNLHRFLRSKVKFVNTLWEFPQLDDNMRIAPDEAHLLVQARQVRLPVLFLLRDDLGTHDIVFPGRNDFHGLSGYVARLSRTQKFAWIDRCGEMSWLEPDTLAWNDTDFCLAAGTLGDPAFAVTRFGRGEQPLGMDTIRTALGDAPSERKAYGARKPVLDTIQKYTTAHLREFTGTDAALEGAATLVAAGGSGRPSFVYGSKDRAYLEPGLNLIRFDGAGDVPQVMHVDPCAADGADGSANLARTHADLEQRGSAWALVKTPVPGCAKPLTRRLQAVLGDRGNAGKVAAQDGYIAIAGEDGQFADYTIPAGVSLGVHATQFMRPRPALADSGNRPL